MMIKCADDLDSIGLYKEADMIDKIILSTLNYNLSKKPITPIKKMDDKLNNLQYSLQDVREKLDEPSEESNVETKLDITPELVDNVEKSTVTLR